MRGCERARARVCAADAARTLCHGAGTFAAPRIVACRGGFFHDLCTFFFQSGDYVLVPRRGEVNFFQNLTGRLYEGTVQVVLQYSKRKSLHGEILFLKGKISRA